MGFHKRWINKEQLIERYSRRGILGLEEYFGKADALICEDELSEKVIDELNSEKSNVDKWNDISQLVSDALIDNLSVKKWGPGNIVIKNNKNYLWHTFGR